MWQLLHDAWWRLATQSRPRALSDALACSVLHMGSIAYRGAVALRNAAYEYGISPQARLPCRVVSVGNLTVGGSGKTACTELIANKLKARGCRVAVLSRGYGGRRRAYWLRWENGKLLLNGQTGAAHDGLADEPQLLAQHLEGIPIVVGARRDRTGRLAATKFQADVVILDDGFQHRRLARDCDIVLIQSRMPLSGWDMLPRGPMREGLTALARAHIVIITKADQSLNTVGALTERLRMINPNAAFATAEHAPDQVMDGLVGKSMELTRLDGLRLGLLSSIGDPEGFEATIGRCQANICWHKAFPDHHKYREADWTAIMKHVEGNRPDAVVTTEKDWVRLKHLVSDRPLRSVPVWVLTVRMHLLSGEEAVDAQLAALYTP